MAVATAGGMPGDRVRAARCDLDPRCRLGCSLQLGERVRGEAGAVSEIADVEAQALVLRWQASLLGNGGHTDPRSRWPKRCGSDATASGGLSSSRVAASKATSDCQRCP